ncbi:MAG: TnpV protein [Clostridia bacterium]|nr:TnpV protein [Clostridia bacterium]
MSICGDSYIPDIRKPKGTRPIGRRGYMHRDFIKEHHPIRFNDLCLSGELRTDPADLHKRGKTQSRHDG